MTRNVKTAKHHVDPKPVKKPKYADPVIGGYPLAWRFSGCDKGGPFSWSGIDTDIKFREIVEKLNEFETKTWAQLLNAGSHPIPKDRISKGAQDRLRQIERDDVDELMSFSLTGPNRVWCIQSGHIMRILWWDPAHQVYPVERDKADRRKRQNR